MLRVNSGQRSAAGDGTIGENQIRAHWHNGDLRFEGSDVAVKRAREGTPVPLVRMLEREEVPPNTQRTFDAGIKLHGKTLDAWRVIAHNPAIFEAYLPFLQAVFAEGALDARTKHLISVRVTLLNHCRYSLSHGVSAARDHGILDKDLVALARLDENRDQFTERELAALDFTDELTTRVDDVSADDEPTGVTTDTLARVQEMFSDPELVELAMSVSLWNLLTRFLRVMDLDLDMQEAPPEMEAVI